ncbi:NAD-dependent epimerase/dehydratase family protein [Halobacteriales archaeon Cl-PHB]
MADLPLPDPLQDTTVVVTGGAGFIGSHLVEALDGECEVRVLDDLSSGEPENVPDGVELVEGDVRDAETVAAVMRDADVVYHLAGLVSVERSTAVPAESNGVNVGGTMTVLEAARRADARVVAASSAAVYGPPESVPVTETARLRPTNPYGVDKLALDHYTRLYADLYGLPTVALRYFNVYGPGQPPGDYAGVITAFVDRARAGDPLTVHGDGSQTRDFVHVSDVVRANLLAATTDAVGNAYNVGTGTEVSIRELAETVRGVTDADVDVVHTDPRPGDVQRSCADLTRSQRDLDFEPRVALSDGLATLVGLTD